MDSADFWKDQYHHVHKEKKLLEDKVHRLQEEKRLADGFRRSQSHHNTHQTFIVEHLIDNAIYNGTEKRTPPYDEGCLHVELNRADSATDDHLLRISSYGK